MRYKIISNEFVVDSSRSTTTNPFSIELLLQEAKITNKRIPQYTEFLKTLGVEENKLHLLTRNELKEFAKEYKKDHSEFILVPLDAAAIIEAAANWGRKGKNSISVYSFRVSKIYLITIYRREIQ